ncbi:response regulator transcription factor [Mumia sp. DW29H23]|uniref:helix-turn-helix transcriptional regulator n=1 Tax=Mumia sp. DW29H23 TaxID=3421241 RepID=UPI003D69EA5D
MPDAAQWIGVAADVLTLDDLGEARQRLTDHLLREFGADAGARIAYDARTGALTLHGFPRDIAFDTERWPYGLETLTHTHPLLLHYVRTGSVEPEVLLRPGVSTRTLPMPLVSLLRSVGVGLHQLALPLRNDPDTGLEAYVLVRDEPFPRWALPRARALHDLVRGLDQHLRLRLAAPEAQAAAPGDDVGLTPRELTILSMLAESRTAESIGRSLGISARTVHKHLENVYRKLGVSDRVAAVTAAQRRGLFPASAPAGGAAATGPGTGQSPASPDLPAGGEGVSTLA